MLSALSVLVGGSLAQPLQFWGLSFVIVSSLELYTVFFRGFAEAKTRSWDVGFKL